MVKFYLFFNQDTEEFCVEYFHSDIYFDKSNSEYIS
jgi:hypothetical protein